jgi:hypothetical protein
MSNTSKRPGSRRTLAQEIDRLDAILDGLADALNSAVADAVRTAVGHAVREALRDAVTRLPVVPNCVRCERGRHSG